MNTNNSTQWFAVPKSTQSKIETLLERLKDHDLGTYEHCQRVGQAAYELSGYMGLNSLQRELSYYAGLLHDIGKLKVPENIINKPGRLTEEEYGIMKKHTEFGEDLVKPLVKDRFMDQVCRAVRYHHERVDGKGYYNLSESKIPVYSKIILVVDTVDAMTQDRAYRKGLSLDIVTEELLRCSGTQFDASIVDTYIAHMMSDTSIKIAA